MCCICGPPPTHRPSLMKYLLKAVLIVIRVNSICWLWNSSFLIERCPEIFLVCSALSPKRTGTYLSVDLPFQSPPQLLLTFGTVLTFLTLVTSHWPVLSFFCTFRGVLQRNSITLSPWMTWADLSWVAFNLLCFTTLLCCECWLLTSECPEAFAMPLYLKHYRKFIKCLLNNEGMANTMLSLPLFCL